VPYITLHLHTNATFWLRTWKLPEDTDAKYSVPPSTLRLHIESIFRCPPGISSSTLTHLFWCHARILDCTYLQFFGCYSDTSRGHSLRLSVPHSTLRLHVEAIFGLPPWTFLEDNEFYWMPPSTLRLHNEALFFCTPRHLSSSLTKVFGLPARFVSCILKKYFGCYPGQFSRTMKHFFGATLDNSHAH
jgi:hypothetical protein